MYGLSYDDLTGFRIATKPRRKIRHAADGSILASPFESDQSQRRETRGNANSKSKFVASAAPLLCQTVHAIAHIQGQPNCAFSMIVTRNRIIKDDHNSVTDKPIQRPLILEDELSYVLMIFAKDRHDLFRLGPVCERGKTAQIAEYDRHFPTMTGQASSGASEDAIIFATCGARKRSN